MVYFSPKLGDYSKFMIDPITVQTYDPANMDKLKPEDVERALQALEQAGSGHGQVVALVGEAGLGKSRLAYEFVHSHHTQGWRVLESASVSYGKATPYFPVIDLLKRCSRE